MNTDDPTRELSARERYELFAHLGGRYDETIEKLIETEDTPHHRMYHAYRARLETPPDAACEAQALADLLLQPVLNLVAAESHLEAVPATTSSDSISASIAPARAGDPQAAQRLWERYFDSLVWELGAEYAEQDEAEVDRDEIQQVARELLWPVPE